MKSKICRFKYENVVFIALVIFYVYSATTRTTLLNNSFGDLSNFYTTMIQLIMAYGIRELLHYIRKNPETLKTEIRDMFQDK